MNDQRYQSTVVHRLVLCDNSINRRNNAKLVGKMLILYRFGILLAKQYQIGKNLLFLCETKKRLFFRKGRFNSHSLGSL